MSSYLVQQHTKCHKYTSSYTIKCNVKCVPKCAEQNLPKSTQEAFICNDGKITREFIEKREQTWHSVRTKLTRGWMCAHYTGLLAIVSICWWNAMMRTALNDGRAPHCNCRLARIKLLAHVCVCVCVFSTYMYVARLGWQIAETWRFDANMSDDMITIYKYLQ